MDLSQANKKAATRENPAPQGKCDRDSVPILQAVVNWRKENPQ